VAPASIQLLDEGGDEERYAAIAPRGCAFRSGAHRLVASTRDGRDAARERMAELVRADPVIACDDAGCRACHCTCNPARPDDLCLACMGIKEL
jgi:hypothetical protein